MGNVDKLGRIDASDAGDRDGSGRCARHSRRRSSTRITLVLIGAASIQGCGDPEPPALAQRDLYDHHSKCVQDWGEERKCELITDGQHRGYWYGPIFYGASRGPGYSGYRGSPGGAGGTGAANDAGPSKNAVGTHRVARSGFGSSASAHSSGS